MRSTEHSAHVEPSETDIQKAAYFLWLERGRPNGCDLDLWLSAKERLRHRAIETAPVARRASAAARGNRRTRISNSN